MNESTRQKKFAKLIQEEVSQIFQREARELTNGYLITVTIVRVSADLGIAKVYLSFLPDRGKGEQLELIRQNTKNIRQALATHIRHQVRVIPELHFFMDDTEEEASKMQKLIDGLDIPPPNDEEDFDGIYKKEV
jgi:ribosome-binding factor A